MHLNRRNTNLNSRGLYYTKIVLQKTFVEIITFRAMGSLDVLLITNQDLCIGSIRLVI